MLNLCQDQIAKASDPPDQDLNVLLSRYYASQQSSEKQQIIGAILGLIDQFNILEKAYEKWESQLEVLHESEVTCAHILPFPQHETLAAAIHTLHDGHKKLLLMYVVMNKFKGVT